MQVFSILVHMEADHQPVVSKPIFYTDLPKLQREVSGIHVKPRYFSRYQQYLSRAIQQVNFLVEKKICSMFLWFEEVIPSLCETSKVEKTRLLYLNRLTFSWSTSGFSLVNVTKADYKNKYLYDLSDQYHLRVNGFLQHHRIVYRCICLWSVLYKNSSYANTCLQ